jgi:hypothetical protein
MPALWARSDSESLAVGGVAEWLAQSVAAVPSERALLLPLSLVAVAQSMLGWPVTYPAPFALLIFLVSVLL